eukprot:3191158-Rhodomonas_salina.3
MQRGLSLEVCLCRICLAGQEQRALLRVAARCAPVQRCPPKLIRNVHGHLPPQEEPIELHDVFETPCRRRGHTELQSLGERHVQHIQCATVVGHSVRQGAHSQRPKRKRRSRRCLICTASCDEIVEQAAICFHLLHESRQLLGSLKD